jgi:hypothetical protein
MVGKKLRGADIPHQKTKPDKKNASGRIFIVLSIKTSRLRNAGFTPIQESRRLSYGVKESADSLNL